MKTKLFTDFYFDEEDIKDFKDFIDCNDTLFDCIYSDFENEERFPEIDFGLFKNIAKKTGEQLEKVSNVYYGFYKIINILKDNDVNIDNLIEDINEQYDGKIIHDNLVMKKRFLLLSELSTNLNVSFLANETSRLGSPIIISSTSSIILKPVIKKRFDFEENSLENYKPEIVTYDANVLVEITTSDDNNIVFQASPKAFEKFISNLISLQIELKAVIDEYKNR